MKPPALPASLPALLTSPVLPDRCAVLLRLLQTLLVAAFALGAGLGLMAWLVAGAGLA